MKNEKEIIREYELLTKESGKLIDKINDNWEKREKLRSEYQTLTGKDISERHQAR